MNDDDFTNEFLHLLSKNNLFMSLLFIVSPSVKAPNTLVGSPVEANVLLQCMVEAFPKPLNGWYKNEGTSPYLLQRQLLIKHFLIYLVMKSYLYTQNFFSFCKFRIKIV